MCISAYDRQVQSEMCNNIGRYPSDDINKFLWMVRIGGGVFPDIKEPDYLGERGYTIDDKAGQVCLL